MASTLSLSLVCCVFVYLQASCWRRDRMTSAAAALRRFCALVSGMISEEKGIIYSTREGALTVQ